MDVTQLILDTFVTGLPYTFMFLGIWLIFRLLSDFDLTVEGSFTLGAAVSVTLILHGWNPVIATVIAAGTGALAGFVTAAIHLRMKVILLLSGIITMIALYTVNLRTMGTPNLSLIGHNTIFTDVNTGGPIASDLQVLALLAALIVVIGGSLGAFLKTEVGLGLRAAGANPRMARAAGINTNVAVLVFLVLANALVGLSGAVVAQQQNFADINMGIGVMIIGIASILLGEIFFRHSGSVWLGIFGVLLGTIIYYVAVAVAVRLGLLPTDLKAFTSVLLLFGIALSIGIGKVDRQLRTRRTRRRQALPSAPSADAAPLFADASNQTTDVGMRSGLGALPATRHPKRLPAGEALRLEGVQVTYNSGMPNETHALRGVDLALTRGDFLTVIGSNGAGKSTLISVVAGAVAPTEGRVFLGAVDVSGEAEHRRARRVARVFQDPLAGTCPEFTIEENLALAARRGVRRTLKLAVTRRKQALYREFLGQFGLGLEDRLAARAGALSGGQRQALSILMSVLQTPDLLLLDEHTAALDPRNQTLLLEMTNELVRETGCTTIMVTHNMEHAIRYGNRMIMLHRGKVLMRFDEQEKCGLSAADVLALFHQRDDAVISDEMLMS